MAEAFLGVFAVDPGKRTGIAQGVFRDGSSSGATVRELVETALADDWVRSREVVLDEADGRAAELSAAEVIARLWTEFAFACLAPRDRGRGSRAVWEPCRAMLVVEEWTPRLPLASAAREVLYPVRIASCLEGLLYGRLGAAGGAGHVGPVYQSPSSAKRFVTDERLKRWGLWRKGSDHERDAYRHMCLALSGL